MMLRKRSVEAVDLSDVPAILTALAAAGGGDGGAGADAVIERKSSYFCSALS